MSNSAFKISSIFKFEKLSFNEWLKKTRFFFGVSSIRSGTVFLTNMFNLELKNAYIGHEANVDDYWTYHKVVQDSYEALKYFQDFRLKDMFFRTRHHRTIKLYGEFNPMLRIHCRAIQKVLPQAKVFHIVRDARDAIRSVMSKEILGPKDPLGVLIRPPSGDPYQDEWSEMSRFEKLCWQWQHDNRIMGNAITHRIHFEQMLSDYDYFKEKLLDFLDVSISQESWQRYVSKPRNATHHHRLDTWEHWPKDQCAALERICGDEMAKYGYRLS